MRQDGIDVLVDLGGHLAHNRLRVFARRPAPVQLSWLGYAAGTGVPAIDFRLTDAVCDPPGETAPAGEALARLPGPFCCYGPPLHVPQRIGPPSDEAGGVVFGSLHKLEKLNDRVLDLSGANPPRRPDSRLLLCRNTLQGATARGRPLARTARGRGLPAERVELRHVAPVGLQHLRAYDGIDVALDCFPWSGHTTACEALWMGAPVVTLRGRSCAGRMVASVLEAVGLPELVAETPDDYRRVAAELARDAARRKGLRDAAAADAAVAPVRQGRLHAGAGRGLPHDVAGLVREAGCRGRLLKGHVMALKYLLGPASADWAARYWGGPRCAASAWSSTPAATPTCASAPAIPGTTCRRGCRPAGGPTPSSSTSPTPASPTACGRPPSPSWAWRRTGTCSGTATGTPCPAASAC